MQGKHSYHPTQNPSIHEACRLADCVHFYSFRSSCRSTQRSDEHRRPVPFGKISAGHLIDVSFGNSIFSKANKDSNRGPFECASDQSFELSIERARPLLPHVPSAASGILGKTLEAGSTRELGLNGPSPLSIAEGLLALFQVQGCLLSRHTVAGLRTTQERPEHPRPATMRRSCCSRTFQRQVRCVAVKTWVVAGIKVVLEYQIHVVGVFPRHIAATLGPGNYGWKYHDRCTAR